MISAGEVSNPDFAVSIPGQDNTTGLAFSNIGSTGGAGGSGMSMSTAGGVAAVGQAVGQIITGIHGYCTQSKLLDIQEEMAIAQYDHQDTMAKLNRDMQFENLRAQEEKIDIQVDGQKEYLAAKRNTTKQEGKLAVVKEQIKQKELSSKTAVISKKKLQGIFDNYSYGKPLKA